MLQKSITAKQSLILNEAKRHLGVPYEYGAPGPTAFDSSYFVRYVYKKSLGLSLPKSSYDQLKIGLPINKNNILPGDLIFSLNGKHVSIYCGENQVIHAPCKGRKVSIAPLFDFYTARRLI